MESMAVAREMAGFGVVVELVVLMDAAASAAVGKAEAMVAGEWAVGKAEAMVVVGQVVVTSNLPARGVPLGP